MKTETSPKQEETTFFKTKTGRMLIVGLLIVVLLIPLTYIKKLINERAGRQQNVVSEINEKWGSEVLLYGPILKIPYKTYREKKVEDKDTKKIYSETITEIKHAYFFPEKLDISATLNPEKKQYGIYETAVYTSAIDISGSYTVPDLNGIDLKNEDMLWEKARLVIQLSNLKGVGSEVAVTINKKKYPFTSSYNAGKYNNPDDTVLHNLESKYLELSDFSKKEPMQFSLKLRINGSEQIRFIPIGKETDVELNSNWNTANFTGNFLPYNSDKIRENGFSAKWKVLDINRPFPQQFFNRIPDLETYAFGVNFMIPVDEYQKSERSAKYGYLVIALTFLVFFLLQTMSNINMHPFQYLMIGLALSLFYTLLLSISEHSSFLKAYGIATASVVALVTAYSGTILRQFKFSLFIGSVLTVLYAFIFVIIQLENYALLVGSIGLFIILAIVMFASRKIDWSID